MATHSDLRAFQAARALFLATQRWSESRYSPPRAALHGQLRRAALSVMLNLAEGHASGRSKRGRNLYRIAFGSAVETAEILSVCAELGDDIGAMAEQASQLKAMCWRLWERTHIP